MRTLLTILILGWSALPVAGESDPAETNSLAWELCTGWASRYVTEGRDNLAGQDLLSVGLSLTWEPVELSLWHGATADGDYREWNFRVACAGTLGPLEWSAGYTRLEFAGEDPGDHEFGLELVSPEFAGLSACVAYRYSTGADGGFLEVGLSGDYALPVEGLSLAPYLVQAFDLGYASTTYEGPNHCAAGCTLGWEVGCGCTLAASVHHAWAQGDVRRDDLGDVGWVEVSGSVAW